MGISVACHPLHCLTARAVLGQSFSPGNIDKIKTQPGHILSGGPPWATFFARHFFSFRLSARASSPRGGRPAALRSQDLLLYKTQAIAQHREVGLSHCSVFVVNRRIKAKKTQRNAVYLHRFPRRKKVSPYTVTNESRHD